MAAIISWGMSLLMGIVFAIFGLSVLIIIEKIIRRRRHGRVHNPQ